jgi:succinate dehydrogenase hydrophobic anchor subunit
MAAKPRTISLAKRGFDFETFMWYFTRLSALAMYLCAFIGMIGALIIGARTEMNMADLIRWTFMPSPTHVINTNIPDLAPWSTLFWKIMGSTFIVFATSHGLHGLLSVIEDYLAIPWLRRTLRIIVAILTVAMIGIAIYVLWTA